MLKLGGEILEVLLEFHLRSWDFNILLTWFSWSWAIIKEQKKNNKVYFKEGMVLSNEPGYYENGKFGIRIENLVRVKKNKKGYLFDNLTMAPIDKSLINKRMMEKNEIVWLNKYHRNVLNNLKKFMNRSELLELKLACSKI